MFIGLQIWRGIAAILVLLFHASLALQMDQNFGVVAKSIGTIFSFGGVAGVAFFFVLSGFIITYRHCDDMSKPDRLLEYVWKRVVRVYPPYLIVFFGLILVKLIAPFVGDPVPTDPWVLAKAALLLPQGLMSNGGEDAPVVHVAWSLYHEVFFYAIFALGIINRWILVLVVFAYIANFVFGIGFFSAVPMFSSHMIILFAMGAIISCVHMRFDKIPAKFLLTSGTFAFFALGLYINFGHYFIAAVYFDICYGLISAIIIFAIVRNNAPCNFPRFSNILGDASYSLYLVHLPIVSVLAKLLSKYLPHTPLMAFFSFLLMVTVSLLVGLIFHIFFEKPSIAWLNSLRAAGGRRA